MISLLDNDTRKPTEFEVAVVWVLLFIINMFNIRAHIYASGSGLACEEIYLVILEVRRIKRGGKGNRGVILLRPWGADAFFKRGALRLCRECVFLKARLVVLCKV